MHTGRNSPLWLALLSGVDGRGGHEISLKPVPCLVPCTTARAAIRPGVGFTN